MRIIINADDFGRNQTITRAIIDAFKKGWITNTTIMANMPAFTEAVERSKQAGVYHKIGLHLNLTQGVPLTHGIRKNRIFCNEKGEFTGNIWGSLKDQFFLDKASRANVRDEMEAQIRKYLNAGFPQKHIDSHHHVHTIYSVFAELRPLLKQYDFRSARLSANIHRVRFHKKIYKSLYNRKLKRSVPISTDYFDQCKFFKELSIDKHEDAVVELMCHPDYKGDDLVNVGGRRFEMLEQLTADDRIELTSY